MGLGLGFGSGLGLGLGLGFGFGFGLGLGLVPPLASHVACSKRQPTWSGLGVGLG